MKKIGIVLLSLLCGYVAYTQNYNEYNNIKLIDVFATSYYSIFCEL